MQGTRSRQCRGAQDWMFRDAHGAGTLGVDAHDTGMLMTLGCSDLQHREAHGTGVRSQQCGDVISQDEGMG